MNSYTITIKPFGEHAILIEWPNKVEEAILNDILLFEAYLKRNHLDESLWETITAYNSLTLINRTNELNAPDFTKEILEWYQSRSEIGKIERYTWKLPVCYDDDLGIDIDEVAQHLKLGKEALIKLHTEKPYTVYGIGFLPGFMYLGGLPKELEIPRRATPRLSVEKGSVGLAGKQTGVYPKNSPGGWNIIGNCPVPIFNINLENPCFVNVGDKIQFYQISRAKYNLYKIEAEVGIYHVEKEGIDA